MRRQDDNDNAGSPLRSAARESMDSAKQAGAAMGGKAIGTLVGVILLLPKLLFTLIVGFTDLFVQFIGIKNAATDALYNTQVETIFRIVGSLILAVGLLEGLVTANIVSQFGVGTEMEDFAFILACFVGAMVGYIMAKVDVSIYITDTSAMNRLKVTVSYAVRIAMAVAYPIITAVGVQMFVLRSEIEQVISGKEAVAITQIKDREVALIRDHENAEIADARNKDVDARKVEALKLKTEYDAHMADLQQKREALTKGSKLTSLMEGAAAAEAARNQFELNEATWQQDFNKRKDESTATLDKRVKDALEAAHTKAKAEEDKIQNLTPAEVADRYDHSWVIKRSFSNKLDALEELLILHPNKAIVANFVKWGIVVFVSLILLLKLLSPDSVKAYFSAHAQAAAGDEKMKKSLEVSNGKAKELLDAEQEAAAAEIRAGVEAKEAEMQAQIQARQIELEGRLAEAEASHQRRLGQIATQESERKRAQDAADLDAEVTAERTRERERNRQMVQALRQKRIEHLRAVLVGLDAVVNEMKFNTDDGFSMPAFTSAIQRFVNPGLIMMGTVDEALELVYGQSPIPWPSDKVSHPDPRGKTPEELAFELGFLTDAELDWDVLGTNPNHQVGMTHDDAALADEGTAVMGAPLSTNPPPRPRRT